MFGSLLKPAGDTADVTKRVEGRDGGGAAAGARMRVLTERAVAPPGTRRRSAAWRARAWPGYGYGHAASTVPMEKGAHGFPPSLPRQSSWE